MTIQEIIARLENHIEKYGNAETSDIYDKGYFAGVVEICEQLLSEIKVAN